MKDARIEGLRGTSALAVLGYHALGFGAVAASYFRLGFGGGFAAVYVFFALSAFLLCRSPIQSWREYYTHRIFRIFPVWVVSLPLFVLLGIIPFTPSAVLLAQNLFPAVSGVANPTWTLTIELGFYALLPLWRFALDRWPYALAGGSTVLTVGCVLFPPAGFVHLIGLAPCAYAFGSLASRGRLPALGAPLAGGIVLGAFLASTFVSAVAPVAVGVASGLLLMSMPAILSRLARIGAAAYPIYLLGYPMLWLGRDIFPDPWLAAAFNVSACLALAFAFHRGIERPMIRVGQMIARYGIARPPRVYTLDRSLLQVRREEK